MFVTNIFLFLLLTIITLIKGRSTITQTLTETVEDSPVITTTLYQITPLKATKNIKSTIIETSTEFVPNRYHAKVKTIIQEKMNTDTITRTITMKREPTKTVTKIEEITIVSTTTIYPHTQTSTVTRNNCQSTVINPASTTTTTTTESVVLKDVLIINGSNSSKTTNLATLIALLTSFLFLVI